MTSSVVAMLLEGVCGKYISGINTKNISVGTFSGKAVLRNLSLKPEALDDLQVRPVSRSQNKEILKCVYICMPQYFRAKLPICVTESHVGAITVVVSSMTKVSIEIDELYLVAKKRESYDWQKYAEDSVVRVELQNMLPN